MAICVDITAPGFKALKEKVKGLSSFQLQVIISDYIEKFGRYPKLEELPNNSEEQFDKDASIKSVTTLKEEEQIETVKTKTVRTATSVKLPNKKVKSILKETGLEWELKKVENEEKEELEEGEEPKVNEEAEYELTMANSKHPLSTIANALSVKYPGLVFYNPRFDGESFIFDYYNLPNSFIETESTEVPEIRQSTLGDIMRIINDTFGIPVNRITDLELASDKWKDIRPKNKVVKAFIYNNEIYVNVDHASISDPIHELMHIFIGSLHTDSLAGSELAEILEAVELTDEDIKTIKRDKYSELEYREEIVVDNLAKYLVGEKSIFSDGKYDGLLDLLSKNIGKALGLGKNFDLKNQVKQNMSIQNTMILFGSHFGKKTKRQSMMNDAFTHRLLNNRISKILKDNSIEVTQECN